MKPFIDAENQSKVNPSFPININGDFIDDPVEELIKQKGLNAPRVTPQLVQSYMTKVRYETTLVPNTNTTLATAILPIGDTMFTLVTGFSSCVSNANFDEQVGKEAAIRNTQKLTEDKLWELLGFALAISLNDGEI